MICGLNDEGIIVRVPAFPQFAKKFAKKIYEWEIRWLYCDRPSMSPEHREFRAWVWHASSPLDQWEIRGSDK